MDEVLDIMADKPGCLPDMLRGNTEALLLFLVDEMQQAYGYQLIKEAMRRSQGFFHFKEGTVYTALRKLENDGLLSGEWSKNANGQERRYYRITARGLEEMDKKLDMWWKFNSAMTLMLSPRSLNRKVLPDATP